MYELDDFGGVFLTTGATVTQGRTVPAVSAYVEWFKPARRRSGSITVVHGGGGQSLSDWTNSNRPGLLPRSGQSQIP